MSQFTLYFTFLGSLLILSETVDTFEKGQLECYAKPVLKNSAGKAPLIIFGALVL